MKKKFIIALLGLMMLLGLTACHAPLSLKDVEKQNRDKWHVTYDLQGGVFSSQDGIDISHYYPKKEGGTYIIAPNGSDSAFTSLEISRSGYFLEGWYKTKDCIYADKWDFSRDKITGDTVLYAKWLKSFEFRFMYQEVEGGEWKELSSRSVSQNGKLNNSNKPTREGYTLLEWYEDEALATVWNLNTPHSGTVVNGDNEATRVVNVYTTWLEGDWAVVKSPTEFCAAINANQNIYLYNTISFNDDKLNNVATQSNWSAQTAEYDKTIEGNGFAVQDVVMTFPRLSAPNELRRPAYCGMFRKLLGSAKLKDITFERITLKISPDNMGWDKYCGLLAAEIEAGVTFENVTLSGKIEITHTRDITLDNFGLVSGLIRTGVSLGNLNFAGVSIVYTNSGSDSDYTFTTDELGLITFSRD